MRRAIESHIDDDDDGGDDVHHGGRFHWSPEMRAAVQQSRRRLSAIID